MKNSLKTVLEDEKGELFIELTEAELNQVGWAVGDGLVWEEFDGGWTIKKVEKDE